MSTSLAKAWCPACGDGSRGLCERCRPEAERVAIREICPSSRHGRAAECPECGTRRPGSPAPAPARPAPTPRLAEPLEVIVFDTETTGTSRDKDRLVELAAAVVHLPSGTVGKVTSTLLYPGTDPYTGRQIPIPWQATKVHGITDAMVASARPPEEVLPRFLAWTRGRPLVAHNASFDRDMIRTALHRAGIPWPGLPMFCTLKLARRVLPTAPDHKLGTLARILGVTAGRAHRAGGDVETTAGVLLALLARAGKGLVELHGQEDQL